MEKITKKFHKKTFNYSELFYPLLRTLVSINKDFYISSTLFFRPENVLYMADGSLKIRLNDYHFFNEKHDAHPPFISHVTLLQSNPPSTTFSGRRSSGRTATRR